MEKIKIECGKTQSQTSFWGNVTLNPNGWGRQFKQLTVTVELKQQAGVTGKSCEAVWGACVSHWGSSERCNGRDVWWKDYHLKTTPFPSHRHLFVYLCLCVCNFLIIILLLWLTPLPRCIDRPLLTARKDLCWKLSQAKPKLVFSIPFLLFVRWQLHACL